MTVVLPTSTTKPTVFEGWRGPTIAGLQARLNRLGVPFPPLAVDGIFGPKTRKAVESFQARTGLAVDGIVGPRTWAMLDAVEAAGGMPGAVPAIPPIPPTTGVLDAPDLPDVPGVVPVSFPPLPLPPAALPRIPLPIRMSCGFLGPAGTVVPESQLRQTIAAAANIEMVGGWRPSQAGDPPVLDERGPRAPRHLIRYWLGSTSTIRPTTLTTLGARAVAGATTAAALLVPPLPNLAPPNPTDLANLVGAAETMMKLSHKDHNDGAWSAAFVVACVRAAAISLGIEREDGSAHVGIDKLLKSAAQVNHRTYVAAAIQARRSQTLGTYHAFHPHESSLDPTTRRRTFILPEVGDIIVQDRQLSLKESKVTKLGDSMAGLPTHGDLITEVHPDHVITVGGNLEDPTTEKRGSVRRRRFPRDATGQLLIAADSLFRTEDDTGQVPATPAPRGPHDSLPGVLHRHSTARIFTVLRLIPECAFVMGTP